MAPALATANAASARANQASAVAGLGQGAVGLRQAAALHTEAAATHEAAGNRSTAQMHTEMAGNHTRAAEGHEYRATRMTGPHDPAAHLAAAKVAWSDHDAAERTLGRSQGQTARQTATAATANRVAQTSYNKAQHHEFAATHGPGTPDAARARGGAGHLGPTGHHGPAAGGHFGAGSPEQGRPRHTIPKGTKGHSGDTVHLTAKRGARGGYYFEHNGYRWYVKK